MFTILLILSVAYIWLEHRGLSKRLEALEQAQATPPEKTPARVARDAVEDHVRTYHKGK